MLSFIIDRGINHVSGVLDVSASGRSRYKNYDWKTKFGCIIFCVVLIYFNEKIEAILYVFIGTSMERIQFGESFDVKKGQSHFMRFPDMNKFMEKNFSAARMSLVVKKKTSFVKRNTNKYDY